MMVALLFNCMPTVTPVLISLKSLFQQQLRHRSFQLFLFYVGVLFTPSIQMVSHLRLLKLHNQKVDKWLPLQHRYVPVSVCGWHSPDLHSSKPALFLHCHRHIAVLIGIVTLSLSWPVWTTSTTCCEPPENNRCVPCKQNSQSQGRYELPGISQACAITHRTLTRGQVPST